MIYSTGRDIARAVGITERAVWKIEHELRAAGYLEPEKVGRSNRHRGNATQPLRYLGDRAVTGGELLELLWRDRGRGARMVDPSLHAPQPGGRPLAAVANSERP